MNKLFGEGADLVMEMVSEDAGSQERDREKKRAHYAEAGIPEFCRVGVFTHYPCHSAIRCEDTLPPPVF